MNLLIIFLCLAILFVYNRTRNYLSPKGFLLYSLFVLVTYIKLRSVGSLAELGLRLDNMGAILLPTVLFVLLGTIYLYTIRTKVKKFKVFSWLSALVSLYFIFGTVQQFFFQSVFTHTLYGLIGSKVPVVIVSAIFFASFHWGKGMPFGLMTFVGGIVFSSLFLTSPNIILPGAAQAVLASFYYYWVNKEDTLEHRFSLKHA